MSFPYYQDPVYMKIYNRFGKTHLRVVPGRGWIAHKITKSMSTFYCLKDPNNSNSGGVVKDEFSMLPQKKSLRKNFIIIYHMAEKENEGDLFFRSVMKV